MAFSGSCFNQYPLWSSFLDSCVTDRIIRGKTDLPDLPPLFARGVLILNHLPLENALIRQKPASIVHVPLRPSIFY
jgi:hypothetical protein